MTDATEMPKQSGPKKKKGPATQSLTCVVVEDQAMFLELLSGMLVIEGGMQVVDQARTVSAGKAACLQHRPDLLLLDITLPDGDGLAVARTFLEFNPHGRVIVVSGTASDFICPAWLNGSLQAVIDKNETFQTLRQEVDALLGRGPAPTTDRLPAAEARQLSARETEIFALIGEGLTTREIAERLSLSEHTVQSHRKRLASKLRAKGDELTRVAIAQRERSLNPPAN